MEFKFQKLDVHSMVHFVGCYALVPTLMALFGWEVVAAAVAAFTLGIVWETFDQLYFWFGNGKIDYILDPRGADMIDIGVDAAGVLLAVLIFS